MNLPAQHSQTVLSVNLLLPLNKKSSANVSHEHNCLFTSLGYQWYDIFRTAISAFEYTPFLQDYKANSYGEFQHSLVP